MAKHLRDVADMDAPKLLLLLAGGVSGISSSRTPTGATCRDREFKCKTCNKTFPTFQALGGHMTGHKRLRDEDTKADSSPAAKKAAAHQCPICGLVFSMGQALGGHMRRHKDVIGAKSNHCSKYGNEDAVAAPAAASSSGVSDLLSGCSDARDEDAVDGRLLIKGSGGGNNHSSSLGPASSSSRLYTSRQATACYDIDLGLRLGLAPPSGTRVTAAVYNDALLTTLRLGIQA